MSGKLYSCKLITLENWEVASKFSLFLMLFILKDSRKGYEFIAACQFGCDILACMVNVKKIKCISIVAVITSKAMTLQKLLVQPSKITLFQPNIMCQFKMLLWNFN